MTLAQLDFGEALQLGLWNSFLSAIFVGIAAGLVVRWYEGRHKSQLQIQQLEHQTRAALRATYSQLLVAQRRSRQASLQLALGCESDTRSLTEKANTAHDEFIHAYHCLNLDASHQMWLDMRGLRRILDKMLACAQNGERERCEELVDEARKARQNLEGSFRNRLGHDPLQDRKSLGVHDRGLAD